MQVINDQSPISQEAEVVELAQNSLETMESGKLPTGFPHFRSLGLCCMIYVWIPVFDYSILIMSSLYISNTVNYILSTAL